MFRTEKGDFHKNCPERWVSKIIPGNPVYIRGICYNVPQSNCSESIETMFQWKICYLGDFAVGKTSLIRRFVEGNFDDRYLSTIGVKVLRKTLRAADEDIHLLVWDMAGDDRFAQVQTSYLSGSAGAVIVADLTRHETLASLAQLAGQVRRLNPKAALVFVGNKCDLVEEIEISVAELQAQADACSARCLVASAKTGAQVEAIFQELIQGMRSE
jgi:small GTP-binding protein